MSRTAIRKSQDPSCWGLFEVYDSIAILWIWGVLVMMEVARVILYNIQIYFRYKRRLWLFLEYVTIILVIIEAEE